MMWETVWNMMLRRKSRIYNTWTVRFQLCEISISQYIAIFMISDNIWYLIHINHQILLISKYNSIPQKGSDPKPPPWDVKALLRKRGFHFFRGCPSPAIANPPLAPLSIPSRGPSAVPLDPAPLPKPLHPSQDKDTSSVLPEAPAASRGFVKQTFTPKVWGWGSGRCGLGGGMLYGRGREDAES